MDEVDILRTEIESGKQFKTVLQGFDKKEVTDTVTRLMVENAELEQQLEKVRTENKNLKKQLRDLQREYADYGERMPMGEIPVSSAVNIDAVREEVAQEYLAQIAELQIQLQRAQNTAAIAMKKAADSQAEAENVRTQAAGLLAEAESALAQAENARAQARLAEDEREAARARAAVPVDISADDIDNAKASMDVSSRVIVDTLKSQIARLNDDKKQKNLRIAELEDLLQQEKEEMQEKLEMLNSINANMMAALQEKIEDLSEFTDEWAATYKVADI